MMKIYKKYVSRCIELAKNGIRTAYPNPLVGCVIVNNNRIIGEGWHAYPGKEHAEIMAIQSVKNKSELKTSTLYINLEPCSHFGKTPPCVNKILEMKIPTIVIGMQDPYYLVNGNGISQLKKKKEVFTNVLEKECLDLNKRFLTHCVKKRPYIILKWVETKDGFIDKERFEKKQPFQNKISNMFSSKLVHKWRSQEHSILVGTQTVLNDNPKLTVRGIEGVQPIRLIIDRKLKIPKTYYVWDDSQKTIFFSEEEKLSNYKNTFVEKIDFTKPVLNQITTFLHKEEIISVIVEGGAETINEFLKIDLWDEARVIKSRKTFKNGLVAPKLSNRYYSHLESIDTDDLMYYFKTQ